MSMAISYMSTVNLLNVQKYFAVKKWTTCAGKQKVILKGFVTPPPKNAKKAFQHLHVMGVAIPIYVLHTHICVYIHIYSYKKTDTLKLLYFSKSMKFLVLGQIIWL